MIKACLRLFKALLGALALSAPLTPLAAGLPGPVAKELRAVGIPESSVAIVVQEAGAPAPSLAWRASVTMHPASVMKVLTTYAALELLGPAYRWRTEAYIDGDDLVLRGYGDPKLTYESFWLLLRALRARGLRDIKGDVVLDRSFFADQPASLIDDETYRPYNVAPDALLVNFKALRFTFFPEPERGAVRVAVEPALPGLEVVNSLKTAEGGCPEGRAFRDAIQATFQAKPPRASFTGIYPLSCGERDLHVALHAPEDYLGAMIRLLWTEMGGSWKGSVRDGVVSPGARLLYSQDSESLGEIVRDINKFSNNVMARQLYLTLAAELGGAPAQPENASLSIKNFLRKKRIPAPELVIENGSGLSRGERISAASLAAVLQAAWASPVMPEFVASLPVVAADGTMRRRMREGVVAGNAHVKTGLLNDVRSAAGYVLDRRGRRQVVVMIVNHPRAPESQAAVDALLAWVYEGTPTVPAPATGRPPALSPWHP